MAAKKKPARRVGKTRAPKSRKHVEPAPLGGSKRIVVLSRNPRLYSTSRLVDAAVELGHDVRVVDTLKCSLVVERGQPTVVYGDEVLDDVDVVIPRIGASITNYGLAVVNQFELMNVPVLNQAGPIGRSRDKLRCLQILARYGVDVPRTVLAHGKDSVAGAADRVGGLPVIVKLLRGTQGIGVMLAHTMAELSTIIDTMWELGQEIMVQEFVEESRGRDVRVFVIGDRAVGAIRRRASKRGEFRSNLHRGGVGRSIVLPPEYARTAVLAAQVVGLEVAGVDLLESDDGPKVMEVNSSPGFEGLERATGLDVAGQIIQHAARFADAARVGWRKAPLM